MGYAYDTETAKFIADLPSPMNSHRLLAALFRARPEPIPQMVVAAGLTNEDLRQLGQNALYAQMPEDVDTVHDLAAAISASHDGVPYITMTSLLRALLVVGNAHESLPLDRRTALFDAGNDLGAQHVRAQKDAMLAESGHQRGEGRANADASAPFALDLTAQARAGKINRVVGREAEIDRVERVLSRSTKSNPMLIGEPGVGKTAVAEGLAQRIADGTCRENLRGREVVSWDLAGMIAGSRYRGDFEERLKKAITRAVDRHQIVFIDEMHTIIGAGGAEGAMDAANILKPFLARGDLTSIGATTLDEWQKHLSKDAALERRYQPVMVDAPTAAKTVAILDEGPAPKLAKDHDVVISHAIAELVAQTADRYIRDRFFPDKAIDVLDDACVLASERGHGATVTPADVYEAVANWTGIPSSRLAADEGAVLDEMEDALRANLWGQDSQITQVTGAIRDSRFNLTDPTKPQASMIFRGPKGVGKTLMAEYIADFFFGSRDALIRINGTEYTEASSVTRLIGAAPSFVGYEEGGQLTEKVRRRPWSVVFIDEADKMDPKVLDTIMQIPGQGTLTDGQGRTVDFRNVVFILAGNFGDHEMGATRAKVGFGAGESDEQRLADAARDADRQFAESTRSEFRDRFDLDVTFDYLNIEALTRIARRDLDTLADRASGYGAVVTYDDSVVNAVLDAPRDLTAGGRHIQRTVNLLVNGPLREQLKTLHRGETAGIHLSVRNGNVVAERATPVELSGAGNWSGLGV